MIIRIFGWCLPDRGVDGLISEDQVRAGRGVNGASVIKTECEGYGEEHPCQMNPVSWVELVQPKGAVQNPRNEKTH
jgi:hypothetical protein